MAKDAEIKLLNIKGNDKIKVLKFIGSLNPKTVEEIHTKVLSVISNGYNNLIADCSQLSYLNSSALECFIQYYTKCKESGGDFRMCNLSTPIYNIFDIVGSNNLIKIHKSLDEAFKAFK